MRIALVTLGGVLAVAGALHAAEFEVASIKPSAPFENGVRIGLNVDGAQVTFTQLSLKDYVRMAYSMKEYQLAGPEWLAQSKFDIAAKLPAGATSAQVPEMLKALLKERFRIAVHLEKKDFPVYGLQVAKTGLKIKETVVEAGAAETPKGTMNVGVNAGPQGTSVNLGNGSSFSFYDNKVEGTKLTMAQFSEVLARFVDKPVVDMTGLPGSYSFSLAFTPEDFRAMQIRAAMKAGVQLPPEVMRMAMENSSADSLPSAVQTLGLRLENVKAPLDLLVVDHAEKTPSEN